MTTTSDARKRRAEATTATTAPDAATVAAVLVEHVSQVGPISGAWHCPCGAVSSNGHIGAGNLTTRAERTAEFCAHLAAAILAAPPIAQALAALEAVARVEALADEWVDALAKGKCPDDECGSCARGEDAADLRAALTQPGSPTC